MALNLTAIQTDVARMYEGKQSAPDTTSKKWGVRTGLINLAIRKWENTQGWQWDQLWTTLDDAADGDKIIATGTTTYNTPTNFKNIGGFVELWDGTTKRSRIKVLKPNQIQNYTTGSQYAYITGDPNNGYTLNLTVAPTAEMNGWTIKYNYYKEATQLSSGTDVSEIPDPNYLIYTAVSELYKADQLQANASRYETLARDTLLSMEQRQFASVEYQPSQFENQDNAGFGV